ncbi:hypothetical protein SteCoe_22011 [Stentor coeruleus]|uniref:Uncharacterized protein n=1 Tax=Stentor coeruleus TaxID=5963 RepID=A0A1R2BN13_9CILI|nr:hypothetical protein SteCoe_22011 [Stentor coeruleus]
MSKCKLLNCKETAIAECTCLVSFQLCEKHLSSHCAEVGCTVSYLNCDNEVRIKKFDHHDNHRQNAIMNLRNKNFAMVLGQFKDEDTSESQPEDQESRNSLASKNSEQQLNDFQFLESIKKPQIREPSFGLGGGEFTSVEAPIEKKSSCNSERSSNCTEFHVALKKNNKDEIGFYDKKKGNEKNTQTDKKTGNLEELMGMITDKEFVDSLKIIGKFANFIERNYNS